MKFKKIFSAAAAAMIAASAIATTASANWDTNISGASDGLSVATNLYMITLFCNDEFSEDINVIDRGMDLSKVGYVSFTMEANEEDRGVFFDGQFGGGVGASVHMWKTIPNEYKEPKKPNEADYEGYPDKYAEAMEKYEKAKARYDGSLEKYPFVLEQYEEYQKNPLPNKTNRSGGECSAWDYYNWDYATQFWGVIDPDGKDPMSFDVEGEYITEQPTYINYFGTDQIGFLETLAPYTYRVKAPVANPAADGTCPADDIRDFRVYLQCWGGSSSMFKMTVTRTVIYDLDGKAFMAFDKQGNEVPVNDDDNKEPVMPEPMSVFRPYVDASITDADVRGVLRDIMVQDPSYVLDETAGMTISNAEKTDDTMFFDISFSSQPSGNVTVKVPTPEFLGSDVKVYHYDADGNGTLINSEIKYGYVVFETDSFSMFALSKQGEAPALPGAPAATSEPTTSSSSNGLPMPALIGIIAGAVAVVVVVVIVVVKKKKA